MEELKCKYCGELLGGVFIVENDNQFCSNICREIHNIKNNDSLGKDEKRLLINNLNAIREDNKPKKKYKNLGKNWWDCIIPEDEASDFQRRYTAYMMNSDRSVGVHPRSFRMDEPVSLNANDSERLRARDRPTRNSRRHRRMGDTEQETNTESAEPIRLMVDPVVRDYFSLDDDNN